MKKSLKILTCSLLLATLFACGDNVTSSQNSSINSPTSSEVITNSSSEFISESLNSESSSSEGSVDQDTEIVYKELFSETIDTTFAKTETGDHMFDGFVMLEGTAVDTSGKALTFQEGTSTSDGRTSLAKDKRMKLEGKATFDGNVPSKKAIKFTVNGPGTVLMAATSASSSGTGRTVSVCDSQGNVIFTSPEEGVTTSGYEWISCEYPAAGDYYIYSTVNGINFYFIQTKSICEKGVENGFTINAENVRKNYLVGEEFSSSGLKVYATFTNGNSIELNPTDYEIDTSSYNKNTAGNYEIKIKYKEYTVQTINVSVHEAKALKVYTDRFAVDTDNVKTLYKIGETLDLSNLVVKAVLNTESEEEIIFDEYTLDTSSVDTSNEGEYKAYISYGSLTKVELPITVVNENITQVNEVDTITVDSNVVTNGSLVNNIKTFRTINDAFSFLSVINHKTAVVINVNEGTYNEKITVRTPNVTLKGTGSNKSIIALDLVSGAVDPNGVGYGTQNSAVFTLKNTAAGFTAENIEFTNTFDYLSSTMSDRQAVAVCVESDKTTFNNCKFSSYQDTLYAKVGRQLYENCLIEGAVDFIFGNNAPCYFKNCEIKSRNRNSETNGGYLTATKGVNSGSDVPLYGYVFDDCDFTAEDGVSNGSVSIGRPWGKDATVAVINSRLGAHISKKAYGDTTTKNNCRYEIMDKNVPTNAHFAEYNNTGEGAITEAVDGVRMLSDEEAATYTIENIFAGSNGALTFADSWLPGGEINEDSRNRYWYFNSTPQQKKTNSHTIYLFKAKLKNGMV